VKYLGAASPSLGIIPRAQLRGRDGGYITFPVWLSRWRWLRSVFRQDCRRIGFTSKRGHVLPGRLRLEVLLHEQDQAEYSRRRAQDRHLPIAIGPEGRHHERAFQVRGPAVCLARSVSRVPGSNDTRESARATRWDLAGKAFRLEMFRR